MQIVGFPMRRLICLDGGVADCCFIAQNEMLRRFLCSGFQKVIGRPEISIVGQLTESVSPRF